MQLILIRDAINIIVLGMLACLERLENAININQR